ncbi:MAG: VWA domain-containing protein, partial [Planctomycetia bacterium]|nr:VWA domain-containing protein [Planctomycetia bacterium]
IPRRRADDGYLLLQLNPPVTDGNWQRETLEDGEPMELLILADTSASMDDESRRRQSEFIASLLATLSPDDRFNVAVCDVACDWIFENQAVANDENVAQVHTLLDQRPSLGWTDLAIAFDSVMQRVGKNTHVVYVGDGVVTARGEDPIEFANQMQRKYGAMGATFHAVPVGSHYETAVLRAIAAIGGGSMRSISGDNGPQTVALELLDERAARHADRVSGL